ncbi:hypothetical protein IRT45_30785 [Nocardia sp. BSTN01]|uniref:hypothetical protein n=1 Tax=Nocardia sp. BSTN01 TaxID=2783665 RepID=UPI00188E92F8|nr:hypothetical protein [Nocardia sp. BSTN01]MBF5001520.1 hypothetical protein [Nocardia sp. BSTN01]
MLRKAAREMGRWLHEFGRNYPKAGSVLREAAEVTVETDAVTAEAIHSALPDVAVREVDRASPWSEELRLPALEREGNGSLGFRGYPNPPEFRKGLPLDAKSAAPHWITYGGPDRQHVLVGTVHRSAPEHPQTIALLRQAEDWIGRTESYGDNRVMFIEGRVGRTQRKSYSSIEHAAEDGEMAMLEYLADIHGIRKISLEGEPGLQEARLLRAGIPPQSLALHHVLRMAPQAARRGEDFNSQIPSIFRGLHFMRTEGMTADDAVNAFQNIMATHYPDMGFPRKFTSEDVEWISKQQLGKLVVPQGAQTELERTAVAVDRTRHDVAQELLGKFQAAGRATFTAYGQAHIPYIVPKLAAFKGASTVALTA